MEELLSILITLFFFSDNSSVVSVSVFLYIKQNLFLISNAGWFIWQHVYCILGYLRYNTLTQRSTEATQRGESTRGKGTARDRYLHDM